MAVIFYGGIVTWWVVLDFVAVCTVFILWRVVMVDPIKLAADMRNEQK